MFIRGLLEGGEHILQISATTKLEADKFRETFKHLDKGTVKMVENVGYKYPMLIIRKEQVPCPTHQQP